MFWLPSGFDRADGTTYIPSQPVGSGGGPIRIGTPTPVVNLAIFGGTGTEQVQEFPDSPEIERAEQCTFQHRFRTFWEVAKQYIYALGRGTFVHDTNGNIWRVLSSKIQSDRGGMAILSVTAESISFDSPPDDYQMIPVELGINIIKHPRYFYSLYPVLSDFSTSVGSGGDTATVAQVKQAIIRAIQTYQDSPWMPTANNINGLFQNKIIESLVSGTVPTQVSGVTKQVDTTANASCALALAAAQEIIQKLWNQIDNPYMAGFQITWSQYYFAPTFENPGSYIENPVGIVPDYFISPSQDGSNTIFDQIAEINPQCYSTTGASGGNVDISWLRKADEVEYQRTWFKVTRTWIGSPIGHWDAQIFSGGSRPSVPSDYLPLV